MKNSLYFKIVTPEKVVYEDTIHEVTLPTKSGEITVLAKHTPLVTLAKTGEIRVRKSGIKDPIPFSIASGVIEIRESTEENNSRTEIVILASRSERASEIDIGRAQIAYEKALKLGEDNKQLSDIDFARFESLIEKESNRIKVYNKWNK